MRKSLLPMLLVALIVIMLAAAATLLKGDSIVLNNSKVDMYYLWAVKVLKRKLASAEASWKEAVERRHKYVAGKAKGGDLSTLNEWDMFGGMYFWDYFTPDFTCPYDVSRVGRIGDGGKWVCGFKAWYEIPSSSSSSSKVMNNNIAAAPRKNCTVYSIGVRDDSSFEEEIIRRTHCSVFAYDFSVGGMASESMQKEPRVKFQQLGLGAADKDQFRTLSTLMKANNHQWIDIFKVDIEGSEYEVFENSILESFPAILPFGQLLIEVHADFEKPLVKVYPWWEKLEKHGLRAFWTEVNHNPCIRTGKPWAVEYSFINVQANPDLLSPPPLYYYVDELEQ